MDAKNVAFVDLSSFMLFEATGDSEADSELNIAAAMDLAADDDDDDAQSCTCDSLEESERIVEVRDFDHRHRVKSVVDDDHEEEEGEVIDHQGWSGEEEEEEEEEEEGDEVAMSSTARDGHRKRSRACVDSAMELRNDEREKSRLFWEACLAS